MAATRRHGEDVTLTSSRIINANIFVCYELSLEDCK